MRESITQSILSVGARIALAGSFSDMSLAKLERLADRYCVPPEAEGEMDFEAACGLARSVAAATRAEVCEALYAAFEDQSKLEAYLDELPLGALRRIAGNLVPWTHADQIVQYCAQQFMCGRPSLKLEDARALALRVRGNRRIGAMELLGEMRIYRG